MGKRGQVTFFILIGVIVVILLSFFLLRVSNRQTSVVEQEGSKATGLSNQIYNFQEYFELCSKEAILQSNLHYGITDTFKDQYETAVVNYINMCMYDYLNTIIESGYEVTQETASAELEINENTIIVTIDYPTEIKKDDTVYNFDTYTDTFSRINVVRLDGGVANEDVVIMSSDKRATLKIPKGVKVTDADGNPVEDVSLRVEDVHFDGLSNSVVVGNLVYEGLPDGLQFSEPVELQMKVRAKDLPEFVTKESLFIGWWDGIIWQGLPTEVVDTGLLKTDVEHFTMFAIVSCGNNPGGSIISNTILTPYLFEQQYTYSTIERESTNYCDEEGEEDCMENEDVTLSGGGDSLIPVAKVIAIDKITGKTTGNADTTEEMRQNFCTPLSEGSSDYWIRDGEAIVPTIKEFVKMLDIDEIEKIIETKQNLERETLSFGDLSSSSACNQPGMEKKEALVNPYCCCLNFGKDGDNDWRCYDSLMGQQECLTRMHEDNYDIDPNRYETYYTFIGANGEDYGIYENNPINGENKKSESGSTDLTCSDLFTYDYNDELIKTQEGKLIERTIVGYNTEDCIQGNVQDGPDEDLYGVPAIYELRFLDNGNGCYFRSNIEYTNDYGTCERGPTTLTSFPEDVDASYPVYFLSGIVVTQPSDETQVCANCRAEINLRAKGEILQKGDQSYFTCDKKDVGKKEIIYLNGKPQCMRCGLSEELGTYYSDDTKWTQLVYLPAGGGGECSMMNGCSPCLELKKGGHCPDSVNGDYFCQTSPYLKCVNNKMVTSTMKKNDEIFKKCEACRKNPLGEDCVDLT